MCVTEEKTSQTERTTDKQRPLGKNMPDEFEEQQRSLSGSNRANRGQNRDQDGEAKPRLLSK